MTYEKHIRSVSRAASQMLGILMKSMASIPWLLASWEMLSGVRPVRFKVLFSSVCSATETTGPRSQWYPFFNWRCAWVWHCSSSVNGTINGAIYRSISSSTVNLWHQDFYSPLSISVQRSCQPCIRWSGTGGFQKLGQWMFFYWPKLLATFLSTTVFHFSSFFLYVGIVGLGTFDW